MPELRLVSLPPMAAMVTPPAIADQLATEALGVIESVGRFDRRCCPPKRQLLAIALTSFLFVACPLMNRAQTSTSAPQSRKPEATVSVRELQVSAKARRALLQGAQCLRKGDAAQSLSHFKRAIQESPDYQEAYYHKGLAEIRLNQANEAMQSFQRAIDLSDGHYAPAYFAYGQALLLRGRSKDAETILRRGLEEDSSSSEGYTVLSITLTDELRVNEAEELAHKALQTRDPFAWKAFLPLADIHEKRGEYGSAVQDLESYLQHLRSQGDAGLIPQVEKALSNLKTRLSAREPALIIAQSPD